MEVPEDHEIIGKFLEECGYTIRYDRVQHQCVIFAGLNRKVFPIVILEDKLVFQEIKLDYALTDNIIDDTLVEILRNFVIQAGRYKDETICIHLANPNSLDELKEIINKEEEIKVDIEESDGFNKNRWK